MRTVAEALRMIIMITDLHDLNMYAEALAEFEGYDPCVTAILGGGGNSVALRLENGEVLKVGTDELAPDVGDRFFLPEDGGDPIDVPILARGTRILNDCYKIRYFIQPEVQPASEAAFADFIGRINKTRYRMREPFIDNVGLYDGRVMLIDPWAVGVWPRP